MRREVLFAIDSTYPPNPSPFVALDPIVQAAILCLLTPTLHRSAHILPSGEVLFALHRQRSDLPWKELYLYRDQAELKADAGVTPHQLHTDALVYWGTAPLQEFRELLERYDIEVHFEEAAT